MFRGALDANIAAVGMRYGLCDGETESVTALRTGARFVHAIKTIEEMGERDPRGMTSPSLCTESRACFFCRASRTVTTLPDFAYLSALSIKIARSWVRAWASPFT